jgi:hypothetical protein
MKFIRYIFYLELLINLLSISQTLLMPAAFITQLSGQPASPAAMEMARWYGVLICVMTWLLFRALRMRGPALKLTLEAYLVGDVIHIIVSFISAAALGWTGAIVAGVVLSVLLGVARIICLWRPVETGIE